MYNLTLYGAILHISNKIFRGAWYVYGQHGTKNVKNILWEWHTEGGNK